MSTEGDSERASQRAPASEERNERGAEEMSIAMTAIARRYIDVWNETDAPARRKLIDGLYTSDASYTDPLVDANGPDEIDATIAGVQQRFAGLVFDLAGPVDAHHHTARFRWHLGAPGADEPLVIGFDVAVVENGRLRRVYGFLDKVPAA